MLKIWTKTLIYNIKKIKNYDFVIISALLSLLFAWIIFASTYYLDTLNRVLIITAVFSFILLLQFPNKEKILFAIIILSFPFNADYPIVYHEVIPGGTRPVPTLWLVDFPLIVFLIYLLLKSVFNKKYNIYHRIMPKKIIIVMILFVLWEAFTIFSAIDIKSVVYQIIKDIRNFLLFIFVIKYIGFDKLKLKFALSIILFAILFQGSWAIVQWLNQSTFGITILGETEEFTKSTDLLFAYTGKQPKFFGLLLGKFASGFVGSPYRLARFMFIFLPLLASTYIAKKYIISKKVHLVSICIALFSLILGFSKSAWASSAISLSIVFILIFIKTRGTRKFDKKYAMILFIVLIFIFAFWEILYLRIFHTNLSMTFKTRLMLNSFGFDYFIKNPVYGIGANNVWIYFVQFWGEKTTIHNFYILLLAETGIVGLLLFIFLIYNVIKTSIKNIKSNDVLYYSISVGVLSAVISFLFDSLWTWLYRSTVIGNSFWILCGLLYSVENIRKNKYS